ncbi:MAG TPA: hypothetical protein ENK06_12745 [Gammaproteobacteria bacterium]|nr:hypothetical protein [Gammaproteobacteria bacterium]
MESGGLDWMQILSAIALVLMIVYLLPRAKQMMQMSSEVENKDWMGVLVPIAGVVLFVIFLVSLV